MILIGGQVLLTAATPVWGAAASLVSGVLALAAWPLRRRSTRPSVDSAWVERAKTAVRLIRPVKDPEGPAVATEVAAQGGTVLDPVRSAAALRAAANLLMAAGSDPKVLQLVGADEPEDEEDEAPDEERGETWVGTVCWSTTTTPPSSSNSTASTTRTTPTTRTSASVSVPFSPGSPGPSA
jgi:hypothetical protein